MWIVLGASAGLGRALAAELAATGRRELLLVARDRRDLEATAADLRIRHGARAEVLAADAADPSALAEAVSAAVEAREVDGLLLPVGVSSERDLGFLEPQEAEWLFRVNLLSVVAVVARLLPGMLERRRGVIVGFGSAAAVRGRSRNVVYAAAKRALESYFESLRHLAGGRGVAVVLYRLGFLDTQLAYGRRLALPRADPRRLARRIVARLGKDEGTHVLPWFWVPVLWLLQRLPWRLFAKVRG